jgi:hypothetical protein
MDTTFPLTGWILLISKSNKQMKKIFVIFVFSMGTILSCSKNPEMKVDIDRESFEKEYAAWEAQHIENYVFTFDYMSSDIGPNGPATISVQNNVSSVLESQTPHKVPFVKSVRELFDFIGWTLENIERSIEDKDKNKEYPVKSVTLKVTYNEQYHYPEKVKYGEVHYVKKNAEIPPGLNSSFELNITEFVP